MSEFDLIFNEIFNVGVNKEKLPQFSKHPFANFPYYNCYTNDKSDLIFELALAGYKSDDIKITVENNYLIVSSEVKLTSDDSKKDYQHFGITKKDFQVAWIIPNKYDIDPIASFENGILTIEFKLDESKKPKQITIK